MKQRTQDVFELAEVREYRRLYTFANPFAWIVIALFIIGAVLLGMGTAGQVDDNAMVFENGEGEQLIYERGSSHIIYDNDVFVRLPEEDIDNTSGSTATMLSGMSIVIIGMVIMMVYFGWWITRKSKEAGWSAVKQLELQQEE